MVRCPSGDSDISVGLKMPNPWKRGLARLKSPPQEVRYHSGEVPLSVFLESRHEVLRAPQKET